MRGVLRIGEVAKLLGISTKTIRHYQRIGLMAEPLRTTAGYRLYAAHDLTRLARIRRLQHLGLSLAQIRTVLGEPDQEHTLRDVLEQLLAACDDQLRALEGRRARIAHLLAEQDPDTILRGGAPDHVPDLLQWVQARMETDLRAASPAIWEQDARVFGLLEEFKWSPAHQERVRAAAEVVLAQPERLEQLTGFAERLAALAQEPEDSPEVERLMDVLKRPDMSELFGGLVSAGVELPDDRYGEVAGEIILSAYSPAQRRFLALARAWMVQRGERDSGARGG